MSILDSLTSNGGSKTKWTYDQELTFVLGVIDGVEAGTLEEQTGRPKTGFYAKRQSMLKFLKEKGCETREDVIRAIAVRHGKNADDAVAEMNVA